MCSELYFIICMWHSLCDEFLENCHFAVEVENIKRLSVLMWNDSCHARKVYINVKQLFFQNKDIEKMLLFRLTASLMVVWRYWSWLC